MSPYERYVLVGVENGDAATGWVYDIRYEEAYQLPYTISGLEPFGWLPDGRLEYYEGCVTLEYCKQYQSASATEPWKMELVEDLSVY